MTKENLRIFSEIKNNKIIYVILIIGVVLMIAIGGGSKKEEKVTENTAVYSEAENLKVILGQVKGAGEVDVMITYYESPAKDLAYETKETSKTGTNKNDEKTLDKQAVMSDGTPMVVREIYPSVKGVIVTAEGADDVNVKNNIKTAVQSVLDVPAYRVCVLEKKD